MNNKVNLCLLADDGYAMQTAVTITSLYINRNPETQYHIYIILNKGSEENIKRIEKLNNRSFKIDIINIEKVNELVKFDIPEISASPTAICKFYIPKILHNIDKVLYIDGDIIVKKDLKELYNINIQDNYIGAVKDTCGLSKTLHRLFKKNVFYFNSGVMIMNLKKMRKDNIPDKLMDYRVNGYNQLMDQDALNYTLKGRVLELPFEYNTQLCCIEDVKRFSRTKQMDVLKNYFNINYEISDFKNIIDKATVLHYSGSLKPWNKARVAESKLWEYYYYKSPFKEIELQKKEKIVQRPNILKKSAKKLRRYIFMHNFIQKKNYK